MKNHYILTVMIFCLWVNTANAQKTETKEEQLDSLINELYVLGAQQNTEEIDSIPPLTEDEYRDLEYSECIDEAITEVEVKVLPTEQLTEIENRLTSKMDAMGAIRFAEKFLQAVYDYDFPTMKAMISTLPEVQSFFTEDLYMYALNPDKREGMKQNATKGIYSKCVGLSDLEITSFSDTKDISGYYKANVYFDAFPKTDDAEFVSLRVMVFQNIENGSFSIFSIK